MLNSNELAMRVNLWSGLLAVTLDLICRPCAGVAMLGAV